MKGILYGNFLLNRKWFVAAGVIAVLGTAVCAVWASQVSFDNTGIRDMLFAAFEIAVLAVLSEWFGRNLEANIKCRFTDITLAGGITRNTYVMSELLKNLITMAVGFSVCLLMQLVMRVFNEDYFTLGSIKFIFLMALIISVFEWALNPLVIKFRSAEKAGLTVGLILGFGVICPVMAFNFGTEERWQSNDSIFMELYEHPLFTLGFAGVCAALYVLFYLVLLRRVKKGDVC